MVSDKDIFYMRRAIELARGGMGQVSPNPMVGAVIVADGGRIIGEGFHRRFWWASCRSQCRALCG